MNEVVKENESAPPAEQGEKWTIREILLAVGAFVIIIALAIGGFIYYQSTKPPLVVEGVTAPDFTYPVYNSDKSATLSDYKGKVVLVNIWNTTCNECKLEMPLMEREYQAIMNKYRDAKEKPFEILAVATDADGASKIGPFLDLLQTNKLDDKGNAVFAGNSPVMEKINMTFPILMDTNNVVGSTYQTVLYPETFIVDQNGKVVQIVIGRLTADNFTNIEHMVDSTAAAQGIKPATT